MFYLTNEALKNIRYTKAKIFNTRVCTAAFSFDSNASKISLWYYIQGLKYTYNAGIQDRKHNMKTLTERQTLGC